MQDFGFNKIMESIGSAFHIFDFSFFISGFVTLSFVLVDVISHHGLEWVAYCGKVPGWIVVLVVLMGIYVCGLVSWMIGRAMRSATMLDSDSATDENSSVDDFCKEYDRLTDSLSMENLPDIKSKTDMYGYMWIKLDSITNNTNIKGRLAYCNRLWVMRALFEGLLFSWLLGIIVLVDVYIACSLYTSAIIYGILLFLGFIMLMYFSHKTATRYANDQIKEIVTAYKIYIQEDSVE